MTAPDLSRLESLAREATPGPWHEFGLSVVSCDVPQDVDHKIYRGFNKPDYGGKFLLCESVVHEPTLAYIAAANPAAVLALIERVRELEARLEAIRDECDGKEDADDGIPNTAMRCMMIVEGTNKP